MARQRSTDLLIAGFVAGFVLRVLLLGADGTGDVGVFVYWAEQVREYGLDSSYATNSSYFPLAHLVFAAGLEFALWLGLDPVLGVKLTTLAADVGAFLLLVALLRCFEVSPLFALLYWLHPYFLISFGLGYIDAQLTFLLLWALFIIRRDQSLRRLVLAGIPLGLMLLYKPQGLVPAASIIAVGGVALLTRRQAREVVAAVGALLLAPALLFAGYSAFFAAEGHALDYLALKYSQVGVWSPGLSANMPNAWAVIAELSKARGEELYAVPASAAAETTAIAATALSIVGAAWLVSRYTAWPGVTRLAILLFATFLVFPLTMTGAHENHLFLSAALGCGLIAMVPDRPFRWLVVTAITLHFVNMFCLYGVDGDSVSAALGAERIRDAYAGFEQAVVSAASFLICVLIAVRGVTLLRRWRVPTTP